MQRTIFIALLLSIVINVFLISLLLGVYISQQDKQVLDEKIIGFSPKQMHFLHEHLSEEGFLLIKERLGKLKPQLRMRLRQSKQVRITLQKLLAAPVPNSVLLEETLKNFWDLQYNIQSIVQAELAVVIPQLSWNDRQVFLNMWSKKHPKNCPKKEPNKEFDKEHQD